MLCRLLFYSAILSILLSSACQSLRHSVREQPELPVHESQERVNLLGRPIESKTQITPRNETPVNRPSEVKPQKVGKSVKERKSKQNKAIRRSRGTKLADAQSSQADKSVPSKGSSGLLFSESQGQSVLPREVETVIRTAESYLGVPYRWGGMSKTGVDCSGLMVLAFQSVGLSIPRVSSEQYTKGKPVKRSEIKPGDLLFFSSGRPGVIGHSALVVAVKGNSVKFIHATSGYGVRYDYLESDHWSKLYIAASRYL